MTHHGTILIVEDDSAIAEGLALNLQLEGFATARAADGDAALAAIRAQRPTLVLLDIGLPGRDGLEVLRTLRAEGDPTPVIVLSARQDEIDKVAALRVGADDYVTKPFGVAELLARVESVLRRASATEPLPADEPPPTISFGDVSVDASRREVTRAGEPVALTHLEFELLHNLITHPNTVRRRQELLSEVWNVHHGGSARTVDNFIAQLRYKLEPDPDRPRHFVTVRGSGYRFDP